MRTKAFAIAVLLLIVLSVAHSISTNSASSTQKPKFDAAAKEEGEATPFTPMSQSQQEHGHRLVGAQEPHHLDGNGLRTPADRAIGSPTGPGTFGLSVCPPVGRACEAAIEHGRPSLRGRHRAPQDRAPAIP